MTVQYNQHLYTASPLNFFRVIFRWKGSVWKGALMELLVWTMAYYAVFVLYNFALSEQQQQFFTRLSINMNKRMSYIPLEFILGFFVNAAANRWTDTMHNLGHIDDSAICIGNVIEGAGEEIRMLRRTMVRYLCLTQTLVFRDICASVRRRFPTYDCIAKTGMLLPEEKTKLESIRIPDNVSLGKNVGKYWMPLNWTLGLMMKAAHEERIETDVLFCVKVSDELGSFQANMQTLCNYDWVKMPLAYPQFVFLSVHLYFLICLFGRQFTEVAVVPDKVGPEEPFNQTLSWSNQTSEWSEAGMDGTATEQFVPVHVVIPVITMLQYIFYVGWMKVASSLVNPFGDEDADFECNFLIDRNFATGLCIVDDAHHDLKTLKADLFWSCDVSALYSADSVNIPNNPLIGSAVRQRLNAAHRRTNLQPGVTIVRRDSRKCGNAVIT